MWEIKTALFEKLNTVLGTLALYQCLHVPTNMVSHINFYLNYLSSLLQYFERADSHALS